MLLTVITAHTDGAMEIGANADDAVCQYVRCGHPRLIGGYNHETAPKRPGKSSDALAQN